MAYIIFTPFFSAVNITDNICTKQENVGLKSAVYNCEQVRFMWDIYFFYLVENLRFTEKDWQDFHILAFVSAKTKDRSRTD